MLSLIHTADAGLVLCAKMWDAGNRHCVVAHLETAHIVHNATSATVKPIGRNPWQFPSQYHLGIKY